MDETELQSPVLDGARQVADDVELLHQISAGQEDALRDLLFVHGRLMRGLLRRRFASDHYAIEDSFFKAAQNIWERAATFDPSRGTSVRAWIAAIVINAANDYHRTSRRYYSNLATIAVERAGTSSDVVLDRLTVRDALDRLKPDYRDALLLKYVWGATVQELAASLHKQTTKAAESTLRHAREALADELRNEGEAVTE